jgi:orotate phosphoribosyltransferase
VQNAIAVTMAESGANADFEFVRSFIDHHCIFRSPPGKMLLTSKNDGLNSWQFYLPIATLNAEFMAHIGAIFWERYEASYKEQPFTLAGCESGGVPVVCGLQAAGRLHGVNAPAVEIKKRAKEYGLRNWIEGILDPALPAMLIDDLIGTGTTLKAAAEQLSSLGLCPTTYAFCIAAAQDGAPRAVAATGGPGISVHRLFEASDFSRMWGEYRAKYGKDPQFDGIMT